MPRRHGDLAKEGLCGNGLEQDIGMCSVRWEVESGVRELGRL